MIEITTSKDWQFLSCSYCGGDSWKVERLPVMSKGGDLVLVFEGGTPAIRYRFVCYGCRKETVYLDELKHVPQEDEILIPPKTSSKNIRIDSVPSIGGA